MAQRVWLLAVQIGAEVRYYATDAVAPVDVDGATLAHSPTLDPPVYSETLDPLTRDVSADVGQLVVLMPAIDPWAVIRAGLPPGLWLAELSLWTPGDRYDQREVIVSGQVRASAVPDPGEAWRITISAPVPARRIPPAEQVVSTASLTVPLEADTGRPYPWLLGVADGYVDDSGTAQSTKRSYIRLVGYDVSASVATKFLVCGHWLSDRGGDYSATTGDVELYSVPDAAFITAPAVQGVDKRGAPVTYVENTGLGDWAGITDGESAEIYLVNSYGLGQPDWRSPFAVGGLGSCLRALLTRAGYPLDEGAWAAVVPYLDHLRVSGAITEQVEIGEWVRAQVGEVLPNVAFRSGPRGIAPLVLRDDLPPDAFALEQGRNAWRPTDDRATCGAADDLCDSVRVAFAYRERTGEYRASVTVGRNDTDGSAVALHGRALAVHTYGRASEVSLDVDWTGDRQTAARIASLWLHFRGYLTETWRTTIPVDTDHPGLVLGSFGRYTDAERRLSDAPCYVIGRTLDADLLTLTLWRLVGAPEPPA